MTLPTDAGSVAEARAFVVDTLTEWRADRYLEVATLLTSELVTNAVLHSGSPQLVVCVRLADNRLRVEVSDNSPHMPVPSTAPLLARGRGLTLVEALSSRWGADHVDNGKCVWFEVAS